MKLPTEFMEKQFEQHNRAAGNLHTVTLLILYSNACKNLLMVSI